jgi:hypothetical protein
LLGQLFRVRETLLYGLTVLLEYLKSSVQCSQFDDLSLVGIEKPLSLVLDLTQFMTRTLEFMRCGGIRQTEPNGDPGRTAGQPTVR